jgi:serine/threonine protein phosphatase PrpC
MGVQLRLFGRTDVGQIREHNEDNFLIADLTRGRRSLMEEDRSQIVGMKGTVFAVCDGMGGAAAGEVASQMAVDIIFQKLSEGGPPANRDELARRLVSTIEEAGLRIFNEARADRTRRGMGTTATVAALVDDRLFLGQVGDSRAYVLRGGDFVQVTRDQSLVNQLIEAGQLTEEEAETFEHNNIILQALGTSETVQVDLTYVDLKAGDALLLCSDGLSGMIRNDEIREGLMSVEEPLDACRLLTEKANQAGGHDNITVLVVKFLGANLKPPAPGDEPLVFRRYASAQTAQPKTVPPAGMPTQPMPQAPVPYAANPAPSQPASALRIGQTMVGGPVNLNPALSQPAGAAPPVLDDDLDFDDPYQLPTSGLPPHVVGAMVVGALLLVAVMGFFLLR